ncbi:hypothetical protein GF326_01455 [Candidatus Bathyarchaeota archaeon]|nr:hypothetical protein [Candidatus Bathyarchaeota archaeon]
MEYNPRENNPTSEYKIIFSLDKINEEDILYVENQITSSGYAKLSPESNYSEGIRTWHLDWKNHGDNPQEIIAKLKKYNPELYREIRVKRLD